METKAALHAKIRRLQNLVRKLRAQVDGLNDRVISAGRHQKSNTGLKGERFLVGAFPGVMRPSSIGSHDMEFRTKRLEVKTALCLNVDRRRDAITRRWTWHRPLGTGGSNQYDYLILLGAIDTRLRKLYRKPTGKFVIFVLPRRTAMRYWGHSKRKIVQLTTDPRKQRTGYDQRLWDHEKSLDELGRILRRRS